MTIREDDPELRWSRNARPAAGATKNEAGTIHQIATVIVLALVTVMTCANYNKLQQECETYRKQLGEFHFIKLRGWQRDGKTLWSVRGKQKAILETQELMDWHSTNCEECNRSAKIPFALTGLGNEPRRDPPALRP